MAKLYLIRHGESVANAQGIYQGQSYDTPLSLVGKMQAQAVGESLRKTDITRIVSSPLKRTRDTAKIIARYHARAEYIVDQQIIETCHGRWEGLKKEEVERRWPKLYRAWQTNPQNVVFPQGETFQQLNCRIALWWEECGIHLPNGTVVVSHDNIIRLLLCYILLIPPIRLWRFQLHPAGVSVIEIYKETVPRVISINNIYHLNRLASGIAKHAL